MNAVFTKRDGELMVLHYENLQFFCEKIGTNVYLKPADHYTGTHLDCEPGVIRGCIRSIGVKKIELQFCDDSTGYEAVCLYTYQTSCMPWLVAILYPGRAMI